MLQYSVVADFIIFGWPQQDHHSSCMAEDEWKQTASFVVLFLGFYINSKTKTVTWPVYKHQSMFANI
jgi:hypothetical protein